MILATTASKESGFQPKVQVFQGVQGVDGENILREQT